MSTIKYIYSKSNPLTGDSVHVTWEAKYEAVLVELLITLEPTPIIVCIKNKTMYAPINGNVWIGEKKYYEFYAHLFPYGRVDNFKVFFVGDEELYGIPVETIMSPSKINIFMDDDKISRKVYILKSDIQGYVVHPIKR